MGRQLMHEPSCMGIHYQTRSFRCDEMIMDELTVMRMPSVTDMEQVRLL